MHSEPKGKLVICCIYCIIVCRMQITFLVHLVLHPHGIAPTFLRLDSWSPGSGFIPIIYTKGINQIKKEKLKEKSKVLCIQKEFNTLFKKWVQFHVHQLSSRNKFLRELQKESKQKQRLERELCVQKYSKHRQSKKSVLSIKADGI